MPLVKDLSALITHLGGISKTSLPLLSVYVDLSPELDAGTRTYGGGSEDAPLKSRRRTEEAEKGHVRPGIVRMRDLIREKDALIAIRGPERESFDTDHNRILEYLEKSEFDNTAQGLVIFACSGESLWEVAELAVPVTTRLAVGDAPLLYPLVRIADDFERFALCIADSTSARIYVSTLGREEHAESIDGPTINYKMTGGLSQRRIQERIGNAVSNHIRNVAGRLEEIVFSEDIPRIVLGGDEIAFTEFKKHLSERAWERVVTVERLDIRLPADQALHRAMESVLEDEAKEASDLVQQARNDALADSLGTFGKTPVRAALEQGAVDLLLIDSAYGDQERREAMTSLALNTGARIEFVTEDETLRRLGGIAALLRWRPDDLPAEPPIKSASTDQ